MRFGFIGAGNMAQAMIGGILKAKLVSKDEIIASAATQKTLDAVKDKFGVQTTLDNQEIAKADMIFLAVKPVYCEQVLREIKDKLTKDRIIVSIAAGKTMAWLEEQLGKDTKIVRTMPNTPALVGAGITAVCPNEQVTDKELTQVCEVLESFGKAEVIKESMMDAVIAVSGSSPAYVFMFIEAMADAAVAQGMPRKQAYQFAAQSVLGSAKMVLETGMHPGELKDMVCSPAGTTIEGVRILEQNGFRSAVFEALQGAADKGKKM